MVYSKRSNRKVWINVHLSYSTAAILAMQRKRRSRAENKVGAFSTQPALMESFCSFYNFQSFLQLLCIKCSLFKAGCLLPGRCRGGRHDRNFRLVHCGVFDLEQHLHLTISALSECGQCTTVKCTQRSMDIGTQPWSLSLSLSLSLSPPRFRCCLRKAGEVACLLRGGHMTVALQGESGDLQPRLG